MGAAVDELHRPVQGVIGEDREQGAENLLLHYRVLRGHTVQDSGLYFQGVRVPPAAIDHLGRVNEAHHPVIVLAVYHPHIALIVQGILLIHGGHPLFDMG